MSNTEEDNIKYCECGCGKEVNWYRGKPNRFIAGHSSRGKKLYDRSAEHKKNLSKALKGRIISPEWRLKLSIAGKNRIFSEEHRLNLSKAMLGKKRKPFSDEWKQKMSLAKKGKPIAPFSDEHKRNIGIKSKQRWKEAGFQKKIQEARHMNPNKLELSFDSLLQELFPKEYKYVGDFQFFLGGKCPDFMNVNGQKKLIEIYGDYWHEGQDPQDRIDHFKEYGFDCLVIWESELKNKKEVINRLQQFHIL